MNEINKITGRDYKLFNYYGHEEAENIIVAMGFGLWNNRRSNWLFNRKRGGEGRAYKGTPLQTFFQRAFFFNVLPKTVKKNYRTR